MSRILAALVLLVIAALPARAQESPTAVAERLNQSLLTVMKEAKELGYEGRYRKLEPELKDVFRLPLMAEISAGTHWKKLSPEEQKALVDAFTRYTTATYASRFHGYSGEAFKVVGEEPARGGAVLVKSQIVKTNGEAIAIDYVMRRFDRGWQIIDVYLKGSISELATRRAEYSSVIGREGLPALLARIDGIVNGYANGKSG
ncbi:MAG: ABC transporter substrate-binding protein [Rhodospirillales bacterium]